MSRKVFFSFHFGRDAWRAAIVRNSDLLADEDEYGIIDAVDWEEVKRKGDDAIRRWINDQLNHTSVTVVLIGSATAGRKWINYEIRRSWERGNGLVGVRIHGIRNQDKETDAPGANPFDTFTLEDGTKLSSLVSIYDWVTHDGRTNLGKWVEDAFQQREAYHGESRLKYSESSESRVSPLGLFKTRRQSHRDTGEQFLTDLGISEDIQFGMTVDARVEQNGFRPFSLRGTRYPISKRRKLTFSVMGDFPDSADLKWKVKNYDEEARAAGDMRGEITDDRGFRSKIEHSKYHGSHYVECYAVVNGVCVAMDRLDVPIGES